MRKLAVISHTEHYIKDDGVVVGLNSTVEELNNLLQIFDEIVHVGMLHKGRIPDNTLPYVNEKISFIPIKQVGGKTWKAKLDIILSASKTFATIRSVLKKVDYFQFRAPTGIGVYVLPYLIYFINKNGWYKYAGNWRQKNVPLSFRFQRWLLKNQNKPVTINGNWENQLKNCLTFENPCLTENDIRQGNQIIRSKRKSSNDVELCFVGRLEPAKGYNLLIKVLNELPDNLQKSITQIHIVGKGVIENELLTIKENVRSKIKFYGVISRQEVHQIYSRSHALILPSKSEGLPKVLIEALNFGCIPIVTNMSSLSQYIKHNVNGLLLNNLNQETLQEHISSIIKMSNEKHFTMINSSQEIIPKFTYSYYNQRIENLINNYF